MKKQEQTVWNGGMLAVCANHSTRVQITDSFHSGRDGVRRRFREEGCNADLLFWDGQNDPDDLASPL